MADEEKRERSKREGPGGGRQHAAGGRRANASRAARPRASRGAISRRSTSATSRRPCRCGPRAAARTSAGGSTRWPPRASATFIGELIGGDPRPRDGGPLDDLRGRALRRPLAPEGHLRGPGQLRRHRPHGPAPRPRRLRPDHRQGRSDHVQRRLHGLDDLRPPDRHDAAPGLGGRTADDGRLQRQDARHCRPDRAARPGWWPRASGSSRASRPAATSTCSRRTAA